MDALIPADDTWTLWAVMIAGTGVSIWLEQTYRWAEKITAPVLGLTMAMVLSNLRVMPMKSPAYQFVSDYLVPIALPLLLCRANLFRIVRTTRGMFFAVHLSALGTILGAIVATLCLRGRIEAIEHAAGMMTASYIGGAINFVAVKESYHASESLASPLLVADNFVMAGFFIALLAIASSRFFLRHFPHPHTLESDVLAARNLAAEHWSRKGIGLLDIAKALAFAFLVVALSGLAGRGIEALFPASEESGALVQTARILLTNPYVLITTLSLALATLLHRGLQSVNGPEEMGGYMLYVFLFAIGLPADLAAVVLQVPLLFVFCAIIAVFNLAVTLGLGKLMGFSLEELLLCSNATLGGPPTAAAMAISRGWSALVLPGLLIGIWGYAIGTFLGILVAEILMRM